MTAMFYPQFAGAQFKSGAILALVMAIVGTFAFCFGNMLSTRMQRQKTPIFASPSLANQSTAARTF